jgi:alpha-beta hydrolase superfamily lysophospholipase
LEDRKEPRDRGGRGDRGGARLDLDRGTDRVGGTPAGIPRSVRAQVALRTFGLALAALFIGGCAYLSEKQGDLIFRPSRDAWWGYDGSAYAFDEQWIPVGDGEKLHAWWLKSENPSAPVLLYLHGARWNLTGSVSRIDRWRKLGYSVLAVDYRGFGESSAASPTEESSYQDAEAAFEYLGRLAPGRKRYIVGHSLGGAIAVELARHHPEASGLVLEATLTSVRDMISESPWGFLPVGLILTQNFDALSKIGEVRMPVLITHGTRDSVVPVEMGERLYAAANEPKRLLRIEGASHHNLSAVAFEQYRKALSELFR